MKAWTHTRAGLYADVLSLSTIPIPTLTSPTQVLVRISHCALNPAGSIVMQLLPFFLRASPAIPEMDFSGSIVETGANVAVERHLAPGTRVFGSIPVTQHIQTTSGALAEYVVVESDAVVKMPDAMRLEEGAGLGIAGATALETIKAANLKKGDSVLVNGASGGIGHLVVQMCQNEVGESGKVVAICSGRNVQWVEKYGVEVIDYNLHSPLHSYLASSFGNPRFDAVIDAVGIQAVFEHCPQYLAKGKPYVTVGPRAHSYTYVGMLATVVTMAKNALWPQILGGTPRPYRQVAATANLKAMEALAKMVEEGKLKVHVGTHIKMDAMQAYVQLLSGHAQGKIVVSINDETEDDTAT